MKTVDYLQLDLEAGKPYMARVQEESQQRRVEEIRRKHQRQRVEARQAHKKIAGAANP